LQIIPYAVLFAALIVVSFIDIDERIIPHGPLYFVAGSGIICSFYTGSFSGLLFAFLGALCGAGPLLLMDAAARLFFKKEGMGMGDVKLMAAAGLVLGTKLTLFSLLAAVWICALWIAGMLLFKKSERTGYLPFGPFLAAGCVISVFFANDIIAWYLISFIG
jgi:leader peptidase (prepilin peptidase)/N-methyltransferase